MDNLNYHHLRYFWVAAKEGGLTRVFNHLLGESGISFCAAPVLAARLKRHFPRSLDDAPALLRTPDTLLRRSLERWFLDASIQPRLVAEFEDPSLMKVMAAEGLGFFPLPDVVLRETVARYGVRRIGRAGGLPPAVLRHQRRAAHGPPGGRGDHQPGADAAALAAGRGGSSRQRPSRHAHGLSLASGLVRTPHYAGLRSRLRRSAAKPRNSPAMIQCRAWPARAVKGISSGMSKRTRRETALAASVGDEVQRSASGRMRK